MSPTAHRILAGILVAGGLFVSLGYAALVALADDRRDATAAYGSLGGIGMFGLALGLFWVVATLGWKDGVRPSLRTPPLWMSLAIFAVLVGIGFGLRYAERAEYLAPLLAIGAFAAVAAFFLRLVANWLPQRRLPVENLILPGVWGALLTPMLLLAIQGAAAMLLVIAAFSGFIAADPDFELDPNLNERLSNYLEDLEENGALTDVTGIVESPTIAVGLASLIAVIAPFSEELLKAVGPIWLLSRRAAVSRADALIAGAAAGLGFGVIEGVGYTLGSPLDWQQMIVIRAPVVVMHVAATTLVTLGWYRYRETGRGFLPYFGVSVALHAGWNGMAIGFVYALIGIEDGVDPSPAQALAIFGVVALLAALFVAACVWLVTSARHAGRGEQYNERASTPTSPPPLARVTPGGILT